MDKSPHGKACGFSEDMIRDCLLIFESGDVEDLFEIIPRIGVLRDPRFSNPLVAMLNQKKDLKRCEFAAYAMGAMGDREFLGPLKQAFLEVRRMQGFGAQDLLIAVIEAIGSLGDDAAAEFFLPIMKSAEEATNIRLLRWIVESLGAIAQQGGARSLAALLEMTGHRNPEIRSQALSELAVAFWHRPNEVSDAILFKICNLTKDKNQLVSESAVAALQSLADVGCKRAEKIFCNQYRRRL